MNRANIMMATGILMVIGTGVAVALGSTPWLLFMVIPALLLVFFGYLIVYED